MTPSHKEFFIQAYLTLGPYRFTKETGTATKEESDYMHKFDALAETVYGDGFERVGSNSCLFKEYYLYFLKEKATAQEERHL